MGKFKEDSDHSMEIEQPHKKGLMRNMAKIQKKIGKVKVAAPNKTNRKQVKVQSAPAKDLIRKYAKQVNSKLKLHSLEHKQEVFHRIVKGLKDAGPRSMSKKERKRKRKFLKKELHKQLEPSIRKKKEEEPQIEIEAGSTEMATGRPKKSEGSESSRIAQFHRLMGQGMASIRDLVAKRIANQS